MDLRNTLESATKALRGKGIAHALIKGFAMAVHGVHRATQDIDLLADGTKRDEIIDALVGAGFSLRHSTPEVLQFGGSGFLDVLLANRPADIQSLITKHSHLDWDRIQKYAELFGQWAVIAKMKVRK